MSNRGLRWVVVLSAALLVSCADPGPGSPPGPVDPTTSAQPTTSAEFPTTTPGEQTVAGTVAEGVEAGCLLLTTPDGRRYLLLGGDRDVLTSSAEVVVRGHPQPGVATTCQQGIPFAVTDVHPG